MAETGGRIDPLRGLLGVVLGLALVALVGMFLVIGKSLILPIVVAVISVYVLIAASDAVGRLPGCRHLPEWLRRAIVLVLFLLAMMWLGGVMVSTAEQIRPRLPEYQGNITTLAGDLTRLLGFEKLPDWRKIWSDAVGPIRIQQVAGAILGSISAGAGLIFMVVVYAAFLMGERGGFAHKIAVALPGESGAQTSRIVAEINRAISQYLAVKTLVNVILGVISYAVMWFFGVDFALFWAVLIGLLNYIPYVGSFLGVMFPVVLSMAQFGSIQKTLVIALLLTGAQMWVGNALEPRMVGRRVNMSPFVVLVALAVWSAVWGVAGAILAIPLTSIIAIVMGSFVSTRPFAVLLAEDVSVYETVPETVPETAPNSAPS
ncbi:AI-2E family transporter [Paracoccus mangrovi]|uniref:AI-2E family transporter n=1 Tax=Paracoccus mangrovi TaxID=1715645 RepID=A0ABV7QY79_9RHOB